MKKKFYKILENILKDKLPEYKDDAYITSEYETRYSFQIVEIAGKLILRAYFSISILEIEKQWINYKNELLIEQIYSPVTISISVNDYETTLNKKSGELDISNLTENEFFNLLNDLICNYFINKLNFFKNIANCDKLLNNEISINESNIMYSDIQSLPIRKVLLAMATNNPNLDLIKKSMYKYCEEQYELGKQEEFEQLCRLKQVFEKMFCKETK
jgi:hypothetical protein